MKRYPNLHIISYIFLLNILCCSEFFGQDVISTLDTVDVDTFHYSITQEAILKSKTISDFNAGIFSDPYALVQGRIPGTSIYNRGGNPNALSVVRVRGLSGGGVRQPLVVIDGVPGLSLDLIDPLDISSINILRDAGSQAAYGMRGTDGVILIETKNTNKANKVLHLEYSGQLGVSSRVGLDPLLSSEEFKAQGGLDLGGATNWQEEITQRSMSFAHGLSLMGIKGKTNYRLSGSYRSLQGILKNSGHERYNANLHVNTSLLDDKLSINFRSAFSYRDVEYGFQEAFRYATSFIPTAPIVPEGLPFPFVAEDYGGYFQFKGLFDSANPLSIVDLNQREGLSEVFYNSLHLEYAILKGVDLNLRYSRQDQFSNQRIYYSKFSMYNPWDYQSGGTAIMNDVDNDLSILETFVNYKKETESIDFNLNLGTAIQNGRFDDRRIHLSEFDVVERLQSRRIGAADPLVDDFELRDSSLNGWDNDLISYYTSASINFNEKLSVHGSLRVDGSSNLGENSQWGTFYSIGINTDLRRIFNWKGLDQFVFTSNYGVTGGIPARGGLSSARYLAYFDQIFLEMDTVQRGAANPDLKWEGKKEVNLGFQMKKGNFMFGLDWYKKYMSDWIAEEFDEFFPIYKNRIGMNSTGIDAFFNIGLIQSVNNSLNLGGYISYYNSSMANVSDGFDVVPCACGFFSDPGIVLEDGSGLGTIYGPIFTGEIDNFGQPVFADLNGNDIIESNNSFLGRDGDLGELGTGVPSVEFGWTLDYSHNDWNISTLFRGALGHKLINIKRQALEAYPNPDQPIVFNSIETSLRVPDLRSTRFSSLHVESADFIKWDNLTISRKFEFGNSENIKTLHVSITANNLLTLSSYTGLDPEPVLEDNNLILSDPHPSVFYQKNRSPFLTGIDRRFSYIPSRSFVLGLRLGI